MWPQTGEDWTPELRSRRLDVSRLLCICLRGVGNTHCFGEAHILYGQSAARLHLTNTDSIVQLLISAGVQLSIQAVGPSHLQRALGALITEGLLRRA